MSTIFQRLGRLLKPDSPGKSEPLRETGDSAGRGASWPQDLPRVGLREFTVKWAGRTGRSLAAAQTAAGPEEYKAPAGGAAQRVFSLRVAALLNRLYGPFFWSGIVLVLWFVADIAFSVIMPPVSYQTLSERSYPFVAILAPTAVGFWTNWLAIKMLFEPRHPNAVWRGLVPARRSQIVEAVSEGVLQRLISPEIVRTYLHRSGLLRRFVDRAVPAVRETIDDAEFRSEVKGLLYGLVYDFANSDETRRSVESLVRNKIHDWTGPTLGKKVVAWTKPLWGPVVLREAVKALPEIPAALDHVFDRIDQSLNRFPEWIESESEAIERALTGIIVEGLRSLDIRRIVKTQLDQMDEQELERMLTGNVTIELKFIQTSGGLFGLLAGVALLFPPSRPALLLLGLALWLAYRWTVQRTSVSETRESTDSSSRV
jgi:hypothetical protein